MPVGLAAALVAVPVLPACGGGNSGAATSGTSGGMGPAGMNEAVSPAVLVESPLISPKGGGRVIVEIVPRHLIG